MSTIDKLLIKGVRSFGPENTAVINFYHPLTLVVGPNGSGKTTIIECLKMATTGDLPPNCRNGQSFIHDPKVSGQVETKGQIKLRFATQAGKDVVCVRNFQLLQKASKLEYKSLENCLQTINSAGEKVSLSYRCADLDREVSQLMGVSKAILENVIFVHQDEANWPLAEPKVLKARFDDIFSATRYTKALETMRKLKKERQNDIKCQKLKLETLQTLKDASVKLQANIEVDETKAAEIRLEIQTLEQSYSETQGKIDSLEAVLDELKQLQKEIDFKEGIRTSLVRQKTEAYNALEEENEDSDEELAEWKAKFHERIVKLEKEVGDLQRAMNDASTSSDTLTDLITKASEDMGKLQAEEEAHRRDRMTFQELLREVLTNYRLGNTSDLVDDGATEQCVKRLEKRLEELNNDYQQMKIFNDGELTKSLKKIEEVSEKHSRASGKVKGNSSQKELVENRLVNIGQELRAFQFVDEEMNEAQEKIASLEDDLRKLSRKQDEKNLDALIDEAKIEKNSINTQLASRRAEKATLLREASERTNLKSKKNEVTSKQRELRRIMEESKDKLKHVVAHPDDPKTIKFEVERAYSKSKEAYEQLAQKARDTDMVEARTRAMFQDAQKTLEKQRSEREAKREFLESRLTAFAQEALGVDAYVTHLKEVLSVKESRKSQHDMADGMRRLFDPFERLARTTHRCPVCDREFTPFEEDEFVRKQQVKRSSTEERVQLLVSQYTEAEARARSLECLRPVYEEYNKLSATIPDTEKVVQELKDEYEKCKENQYDVSCLVAQSKSEVEVLEQLRFTAQTIDEIYTSVERQTKYVEELESQLIAGSSSVRTAEDVEEECQALEERKAELDRKIEKLASEQGYLKDSVNACRARKYAEDLKLGEIKNKIERRTAFLEEQDRLSKEILKIESDIQAASEELEPLTREKVRLQQEYSALKRETDDQLQARSNDVRKFEKDYDSVQKLWFQIKGYVHSNRPQQLENSRRKLGELQAQKEDAEKRRTAYLAQIQRVNSLLAQQKVVERNITDNIHYRKLCADEEKCMQEVRALEQRMFALGSNANYETDLKTKLKERQKLSAEVNNRKGKCGVYDSNITRHKTELKNAQYRDIKDRYRKQLVELKTYELATTDLDKYHNALEKALMRFHTNKMEEVNKIIKELWQQTYRGKDIDYIQIVADDESVGKRNYSYRVVMFSGGAELEMRGRCSAGQKVLASLIIRLALAETFCLNCGILALDEPTSNLDIENSRALAAALLRVLEDRRDQENFQLLVITHDMDFARLVAQGHTESYYRISKDAHQHSLIELQDFGNVGA